jgi:hypothetical protein
MIYSACCRLSFKLFAKDRGSAWPWRQAWLRRGTFMTPGMEFKTKEMKIAADAQCDEKTWQLVGAKAVAWGKKLPYAS